MICSCRFICRLWPERFSQRFDQQPPPWWRRCKRLRRKHRPRRSLASLSDIHIAADPSLVHNDANMMRYSRKVVGEILHWPAPFSGVLINGDLAYKNGEIADYEAVLGLLGPMREQGLPLHLALGNHDYREHFWAALPKDKSISSKLPDRQTSIVRTTHANWFILDLLMHTRETAERAKRNELGWPRRSMSLTPINPPSLPFIIIRLWALR